MSSYTHTEYIRTVPGAKYAVMLIHGILSTPKFWDDFVKIIPDDYSIYNLLLEGHGGEVEDFSKTSMDAWRSQIKGFFDAIASRYEKIILVGHSMGTLFSIQRAVARPDKVAALFLLASPMTVKVKPTVVRYSLRIVFDKVDESKPIERSAKETLSIRPTKKMWKYIPWAPRFLELFSEIKRTRPLIDRLTVPTFVFQSKLDELVSIKSAEYFRGHDGISLSVLHTSSHQCHSAEDKALLLESFASLFSSMGQSNG